MIEVQSPAWEALYETAASQAGLFTSSQAADAGYSLQLLNHHVRCGKFARVRRGVYRLVHFPPSDQEDLMMVWLWADQQGVFSHETALALHELSDALPAKVHLTLPLDWKKRRLRIPMGVVLHYGTMQESDRVWNGAVPVTSVGRTLTDCTDAKVSPELVQHAVAEAKARGLIESA